MMQSRAKDPSRATSDIGLPSRRLLLREGLGLLEFPRLLRRWPELTRLPRGKGEVVFVLPGFGTSDRSTWPLRRFLSEMGYQVHGWGLGRNHGNLRKNYLRMVERLEEWRSAHPEPMFLVGWSLGGTLAREIARDFPEWIRYVMTLGSPVIGGPKHTVAADWYRRQGYDMEALAARLEERSQKSIEVPVTAIYSKADGIVSWQACIDPHHPHVEHVEVSATHLGLGFSPEVFELIAQGLAVYRD